VFAPATVDELVGLPQRRMSVIAMAVCNGAARYMQLLTVPVASSCDVVSASCTSRPTRAAASAFVTRRQVSPPVGTGRELNPEAGWTVDTELTGVAVVAGAALVADPLPSPSSMSRPSRQ
jgi:hypothetical protein